MPEVWILIKNRDTDEILARCNKRNEMLRWLQDEWKIDVPLLIEVEI